MRTSHLSALWLFRFSLGYFYFFPGPLDKRLGMAIFPMCWAFAHYSRSDGY